MTEDTKDNRWPLWEVFIQPKQGKPHEHAGSLHASDAEMALQNARDVYGRRFAVESMWVVPSDAVTATSPSDNGPFFDMTNTTPYRHPQFYNTPRGVRNL